MSMGAAKRERLKIDLAENKFLNMGLFEMDLNPKLFIWVKRYVYKSKYPTYYNTIRDFFLMFQKLLKPLFLLRLRNKI